MSQMKPETYVKRAIKKKQKRRHSRDEAMESPYHGGTYLVGTDGIRAHMVQGDYPFDNNPEHVDLHYPANDILEKFELARSAPRIAVFSPKPVAKVCKAAEAMFINNAHKKKKYHRDPYLRMTLNGSMDFTTICPANGVMRASLEDGFEWKMKTKSDKFDYSFVADDPATLWINPKYLREALAGLKTNVQLKYDAEKHMIFIADEFSEHEAIVMLLWAKHVEKDYVADLQKWEEKTDE